MKVFGQEVADDPKPEEKSNLPEQLQGKSPEEIYEMTKAEHERVVNELKAKKFDESTQQKPPVRPGQTTPQQQQSRQAQPPTLPQTGRGDGTPAQKPIRYWEDPEGFLEQQLQQRLSPLVQNQVNALRGTNRAMFKQQVGEQFAKYEEEVEAFVDALSPQIQADPRAYEQAFKYVQSQHLDEILEEERNKSRTAGLAETLAEAGIDPDRIAEIVARAGGNQQPQKQAEEYSGSSLFQPNTGIPRTANSSQSVGARATDTSPRRGGQMTQEERRMMEEFGMSADEWKEYKGQNTDIYSGLGGE